MGDMEGSAPRESRPIMAMTSRARLCFAVLCPASRWPRAAASRAEDVTLLRAREGAAALMRGQYDKAVTTYDEALTDARNRRFH